MSYIFVWLREPGGQGGCPLGFPPPPSWEGDLLIIHSRVPTSCWSLVSSPDGGSLGGTFNSLCATSWQRSSISCLSWASQGPQGPCEIGMGSSTSWWGLLGRWLGKLLPIWGQRLDTWRLSISYCYICPQMGDWQGVEVWSLMGPSCKTCGFGDSMHATASISSLEWNKMTRFSCQKLNHTLGVCLSHLNTEFNDVFLLYGGGIEWSAINYCQYQGRHLIKDFC